MDEGRPLTKGTKGPSCLYGVAGRLVVENLVSCLTAIIAVTNSHVRVVHTRRGSDRTRVDKGRFGFEVMCRRQNKASTETILPNNRWLCHSPSSSPRNTSRTARLMGYRDDVLEVYLHNCCAHEFNPLKSASARPRFPPIRPIQKRGMGGASKECARDTEKRLGRDSLARTQQRRGPSLSKIRRVGIARMLPSDGWAPPKWSGGEWSGLCACDEMRSASLSTWLCNATCASTFP
jgi:hypothetical protein